jgi:hypothetical protein
VILLATAAAIPVAVVLGTAALLTIGGLIGCVQCALVALTAASRQRSTEGERILRGEFAR